jgi:hypothetical protein
MMAATSSRPKWTTTPALPNREKTFLFDVSLFGRIAEIVQPMRRRELTDERRSALIEQVKGFNEARRTSIKNATVGSVADNDASDG